MTTSEFVVLLVVGFVVFFVALWCFVLWVISLASGWRRLAERFGRAVWFTGEVTTFASARVGLANYNGALIVGASREGLYLVPIRIFRPFHSPLHIPWTDTVAQVRGSEAFPRVQFTFPSAPGKRILLYGRSAKQCLPYLQ